MNLDTFLAHIRSFTNFNDPAVQTDQKLKNWLYMAETHLNENLRIGDMVQIDTATITSSRVAGPPDFIAADLVLDVNGQPMTFEPRTEFYTNGKKSGRYTQSGQFLIFGGSVSDTESMSVELHYFGDVPHLTTGATWLSERYNGLLTSATLAVAFAAMEEDNDAVKWETATQTSITRLNDRYNWSKSQGRLTRIIRGFG